MERKVLKASAGTGKTYRLSLEYAVSLFKGEKIKDIVIMTFTRKATSEIKEDIVKFIKKLAIDPKTDEEFEERRGTLDSILKIYPELFSEEEIYSRAKKAYKEILLNKDNLKIYTIDGLKNNIFKIAIAPMLNINSYEIIDDNENIEYLKKCLERLFENKGDFRILKDFLKGNTERNIENYVDVIDGIIQERWKALLISKIEKQMYETGDKLEYVDRTIDIMSGIAEEKGKTIEECFAKHFAPYLALKSREEKETFLMDNWSIILEKNIHNGNQVRGKKHEDDKDRLLELKEKLAEEISKTIYNEKILSYEKDVLAFLNRVYEIYDEIKFKEKRFTQTDTTNYTLEYINDSKLNLIDENGITTYMKDILESEISTIFIDEFQDTSVVQWKIFKGMIDSATKVICVGDEKQSIYGWRGGEKDLFVNLPQIIDAEEETMDTSYRSHQNIVSFTNLLFSEYSNLAKLKSIHWDFEKVKSVDKEGRGYVYLYNGNDEYKNKRGKEGENELPPKPTSSFEKIVEILLEKFNGNYRDVCILARNNKVLNEMEEYLSENRIPYFLETNQSVFDHRTIKPVIKLLRYFITDNIFYLLEFLRDDLYCLSDNSIKELITFYNSFGTIDNFKFTDRDSNKLLEEVIDLKERYNKDKLEYRNLLIDIIMEFGILEKFNREGDIKNVYNFLDIARRFDTIKALLTEIEENSNLSEYQQSSIEVQNAVTLMTIHKSKGLGFDTVFYIHNETTSRAETGIQFNLYMSDDYSKVKDYSIMDAKYQKTLQFLEGQFDFDSDKKRKREEEEINNLYVALTRSKKNLFVMIENVKKSDSMFKSIVEDKFVSNDVRIYEDGKFSIVEAIEDEDRLLEDLSKEYNQYADTEVDFRDYEYIEEKLEENRLKLIEDEFKYDKDREEKRYIGNIVHFFLENIIYLEEESINKSRIKTISKYGASFGKQNIIDILESKGLKEFLTNNTDIFSREWDYIYPEYEIYSDINNELYRLDRLMIKLPKGGEKGKILIADYKTGGFEESQLEKYETAVNEKLPNREDFVIEKRYLQISITQE